LGFLQMLKSRDTTNGGILNYELKADEQSRPLLNSNPKKCEILIVDDICDGGGTFIKCAESLKKYLPDCNFEMDLYVTHGIFSKGTKELDKYFRNIYTFNHFDTYKFLLADGIFNKGEEDAE